MEFRDLKRQYRALKPEIDKAILEVTTEANYIMGEQVKRLEAKLAEYVGTKYCISCANGTDALQLALMAWDIGEQDAVFVPDFTFFSSGEVVALQHAVPIFVEVDESTFNINPENLEKKIEAVLQEGKYIPKVIIAVDLFGQPAEYPKLRSIAEKYGLKILEDSAQGFGGMIGEQRAGSFGDIATTSFFPAKPLGCYGDGGAIFTNNDEWAAKLESLRIHGKGMGKYDNVRVGMNSRLDTMQAAILLPKLQAFVDYEHNKVNDAARKYNEMLDGIVKVPMVKAGYLSGWAQYTIQLPTQQHRDGLREYLGQIGIPSMVYYQKPMHKQEAFRSMVDEISDCKITTGLCERVLSLPMHPYFEDREQEMIAGAIRKYVQERN